MSNGGALDVCQGQLSLTLQDHCFHEGFWGQTVLSYLVILVMIIAATGCCGRLL
jgi:hypothetical protein